MNKLPQILSMPWKLWFLIVMILTTLLYFPFVYLAIVVLKNYSLCFKIYRIWAWSILLPIGVIPWRKTKGKLPNKKGFIFVSNHNSPLDIIVPYTLVSQHFAFLAKKELTKVPLFKTNFRGMNVTVDRKSLISGMDSMGECSNKIEAGVNMLIFPEGTRSKNAPKMQKFKSGAFKLAISEKVPIVPIVFKDNYKRLGGGKGIFNSIGSPGISRMVILDPIETKGLTLKETESLMEKVHSVIANELNLQS